MRLDKQDTFTLKIIQIFEMINQSGKCFFSKNLKVLVNILCVFETFFSFISKNDH